MYQNFVCLNDICFWLWGWKCNTWYLKYPGRIILSSRAVDDGGWSGACPLLPPSCVSLILSLSCNYSIKKTKKKFKCTPIPNNGYTPPPHLSIQDWKSPSFQPFDSPHHPNVYNQKIIYKILNLVISVIFIIALT